MFSLRGIETYLLVLLYIILFIQLDKVFSLRPIEIPKIQATQKDHQIQPNSPWPFLISIHIFKSIPLNIKNTIQTIHCTTPIKTTIQLTKQQKTPQKIEVYNSHSNIYRNNNPKAC